MDDTLTERPPTDPPHYWSQSTPAARWRQENDTAIRRFLGGSPLAVVVKLILVSFVVGALLMWLHISPADVFAEIAGLLNRLYALGLDSVRDFATYIIAGAAIVIPVWFIIRLLSYRGR